MSSSLDITRQRLVLKVDNWITPLRYKYRDKFKDDFTIESMKKRCPKADENNLKIQSERLIRQFTEANALKLQHIEGVAREILQAFDTRSSFFYFFFQPSMSGTPDETISTIDLFEEFGEAQRVSYETYCKMHENVEEEEDPKYLLARIQLMQREVPESIVCLKYLREFVQERLLDRLPRNFGDLHNLRRIDIGQYGCDLSELPEELGHFPHLKYLRIVNTQIKHINSSLFQNTSLEELDLEHNQIQEIDPLIGNLCRLRVFNVNYNRIAFLPDSIGDLKCLQELRSSDNQLETVPPSLDNLQALKVADFTDNRITHLPVFKHPELLDKSTYLNNPIYEGFESQEKMSLDMSKLDLKECK